MQYLLTQEEYDKLAKADIRAEARAEAREELLKVKGELGDAIAFCIRNKWQLRDWERAQLLHDLGHVFQKHSIDINPK